MHFQADLSPPGGEKATLRIAHVHARLMDDLFRDPASDDARKALFRTCVERINLELTSYCNRRCGFCPNKEGTRLKARERLPEDVFVRIIGDLAGIGYDRALYFHLYNEPLADPDYMLDRMRYIRPRLPGARFGMNSNGDYLTRDLLAELEAAGLKDLYVSIYGPGHGEWVETYIRDRVEEMAAKLGLEAPMRTARGLEFSVRGEVGAVSLTIGGRNLWKTGYDRGELIPELATTRTSPCLSPITDVSIDYRGYMLPCCNVYTDRPAHLAHVFGNLGEAGIFETYANVAAQSWRRTLLAFDPGGSFCGSCSRLNLPSIDTPENRAAVKEIRSRLGLDAAGSGR